MLKKTVFLMLLFICLASLQFGCGDGEKPKEVDLDEALNDSTSTIVIDEDAINEVIQSFSSPVEMAALIENLDVPFSKKYLVPAETAEDYDTNAKKSFALGVLSADLGYLNVYKKTTQIVEYLSVIKKLADDLRVGQFFDFQTLKRLATSNDNLDSLLFLTVSSFHQMDEHLRNNARSNLSCLVVTGVWLEGLYFLTQVSLEQPSEELTESIGEQKTILNSLLPILKVYQSETYFQDIVEDFEELKKAYEDVSIRYEVQEPKTEIIDNRLVITQSEISIIEMTDSQLEEIVKVTEKVRNKLIAL
jgi:hypothetical protein